MKLVDVHAHLCDAKFDGKTDETVNAFLSAGVDLVINSGFDIASSVKAAEQSVSSLIFVRILLESQTKRTHRQENISLLFTEKSILRRGRRSRRKERKYRMHMKLLDLLI